MPGKSRYDRGKHPSQSKKSKAKQRSTTAVVQQQAKVQTHKPTVSTGVPVPSASVKTTPTISSAARHPYITAELKRIGILAGIILVILIVLALVLS